MEGIYTHPPLPGLLLQSLRIFMGSWECQLLCLTSDEFKGAALSQCKARLEETEMHGFRMLVRIFLLRESHIMEMDHHYQRAKLDIFLVGKTGGRIPTWRKYGETK